MIEKCFKEAIDNMAKDDHSAASIPKPGPSTENDTKMMCSSKVKRRRSYGLPLFEVRKIDLC